MVQCHWYSFSIQIGDLTVDATQHQSVPDDEITGNQVWMESFDAETRRQLVEEDRDAWRTFVTLLLFIVIGGVCLGLLGVVLCVWL
ncbi:MAG: hypothetical protein CMJ81_04630 [Planctomycetaceae bacterium]|jgi:hypothetical protein|nr:hypothetical protein [Planctomycetaceae bacterium]